MHGLASGEKKRQKHVEYAQHYNIVYNRTARGVFIFTFDTSSRVNIN